MSKENSQELLKTSTIKTKELQKSEKISLILNSDIVGYMVALHNKYPGLEWSGHLFYEQIGDVSDIDNMKIIVKDFVLLDIGSHAFTEIVTNGDQVINTHDRIPEFIEGAVKQGLLHTH